ncbi:MAG: CRISPR-associated helicase Cas3' [Permianibacter sp.]
MSEFLAHVRLTSTGRQIDHELAEHLRGTAKLAADFADSFQAAAWAKQAGLWHDLGKYRPGFQRYIRQVNGIDAHIEDGKPGKTPHALAGAIHAVQTCGARGRLLAYLIAGHHAGLPDWLAGDDVSAGGALSERLEHLEEWHDALSAGTAIPDDIRKLSTTLERPIAGFDGWHFWLRLVFSALVDADFLDTEAFMDPARAENRQGYAALTSLLPAYQRHMARFATPTTAVHKLRAEILTACLNGASQAPGIFSLTVPTGGGKTLASLGFALHHAVLHGMKRVIYVIPYTSIIEQTADILRDIFGHENVIEHHSNLDTEQETPRSRLACENWDAPIIVTTNVQFLESCYAAKTSRCRKLHNIVNSVVIFDEAQLLPAEFLAPILHVLNELTRHYRVSVVISTATQPMLTSRHDSMGRPVLAGLPTMRELAPDPDNLYRQLQRVHIHWPASNEAQQWPAVVEQLQSHAQVLCIVGRRDDAREMAKLIPEAIHLSALMCAQHRSETIALIRQRLKDGEPIKVVSTQLVEAGVDLDFPVVYRAFAGLDSIAQAAGRCNREGRLPKPGDVYVFHPPRPAPRGLLRKAEQAAKELLALDQCDLHDPQTFTRYFDRFYAQINSFDKHAILRLLAATKTEQDRAQKGEFQFRTAGARFQLIEESGYKPVLVWHGEGEHLIDELKRLGPHRALMRKLQRHTVSLPDRQLLALEKSGDVVAVLPGLYAQASQRLYDARLGLLTTGPEYPPEDLIA